MVQGRLWLVEDGVRQRRQPKRNQNYSSCVNIGTLTKADGSSSGFVINKCLDM